MRAGVFVSLGLSGVIPMLHTIIKNGAEISFGKGQIHWLILMALIYIFGATFYATRFPECKWPGRFDLVFQSHQIFHVMVVIAALGRFYFCVGREFSVRHLSSTPYFLKLVSFFLKHPIFH